MPNPSGINNFDRFAPEPAYGDKLRQDSLQQAAPVPANPALNAPRRAKQRSQRPAQQAAPPVPPAPATVNPQFVAAQQWQAIAAIPGASDLVKQYAAKASGH